MRKRTILAIIIAFVLCFGATAFWSAETTGRDGDPDANIIESNGAQVGKSSHGGNKIGRVVTAPFRAIGRLFGRGGDNNRVQRMTEQDAARFESAGALRVTDARSPAPANPSAEVTARDHLATGRALLQTGRTNEAIAELSLAASLDPHLSEANNLLGVAYDRKGMGERARDAYEHAMHESPEDAQTLNNLGFSLYQNGNYRAAVDRLKRAARLAPTDQRILNNLALAQCRLGKFDDAFKNFSRAGGELTGRLNTAAILERMGRDEDAIKYYEAALRLEPNSSISLRRLAELYKRVGRTEDAESTRRQLARLANDMTVAQSN